MPGGNPEAIEDGVHGILVPFGDQQALAVGILTLAGDGKLRERMAAKARQRFLDEFTVDKMVAGTAAWLMDCARKYARNALDSGNPPMRLLFCCHDFRRANLRLMPWRYIHEVARGLVRRGHQVSLVSVESPGASGTDSLDGITVLRLDKKELFSGRSFKELAGTAEVIVWSASPLTALYYSKLKQLERPLLLLYTGPFYTVREIVRAQRSRVPFRQLATHYQHALAPLRLTACLIKARFVKAAVVLSRKNARILGIHGCRDDKVTVIPPGYDGRRRGDLLDRSPAEARERLSLPKGVRILTYLGSLYQMRGVKVLLDAFAEASRRIPDLLLLMLARTEDRTEIDALANRAAKLWITDRTLIIPGFLEKDQVFNYLAASDAVALPFILVPSDMPLGALEAMALGKPVITTEVDGMPEMVAQRGLVVPPGDAPALAQAMCTLSRDKQLYDLLKGSCATYMSHYPTWEEITGKFDAIIQHFA
jgi:phosphatidyl-myo-inositol dimannoside synthase